MTLILEPNWSAFLRESLRGTVLELKKEQFCTGHDMNSTLTHTHQITSGYVTPFTHTLHTKVDKAATNLDVDVAALQSGVER